MRLWHSASATSAQFDDPNLVSCAGLVPVMRLAQDCGLAELVGEQLAVAGPWERTPRARSARRGRDDRRGGFDR